MLVILGRVIHKLLEQYEKSIEQKYLKILGLNKESNVYIQYPCIMQNDECVTVGEGTTILSGARIQSFIREDNKPRINIGKNCYFCYRNTFLAGADITIGDDVLMASDITITSENHGMDPSLDIPYMKQPLVGRPITIGDGTWIGNGVVVLPGVNIGKRCVIGANAVVTKSIPDYCIAVGNPARIIKKYDLENKKWEKVD